ncbi:unnamed protein product, partial [Ectocarpus sp. 12 AP-2014]
MPLTAMFGCPDHYHYDLVIKPLAFHFLKAAAAHLVAVREEAVLNGEDDDEEDEDDYQVSDPANFNPPAVLTDFFRSIKNLPVGGGGADNKDVREMLWDSLHTFVKWTLGDTHSVEDMTSEV